MRDFGYTGTSTANQDIYINIKAQEKAILPQHRQRQVGYAPLVGFSFVPTQACTIKVNNGSAISIGAGKAYSTETQVTSLIIVEATINFNIIGNIKI